MLTEAQAHQIGEACVEKFGSATIIRANDGYAVGIPAQNLGGPWLLVQNPDLPMEVIANEFAERCAEISRDVKDQVPG